MTIAVPARTYGDLILNPLVGVPGQQSVPATVSALANDGTFTFNYNLTQGNNFLTILASSGETITSTTITSRAGLPTCGKFAFRGFLASLRRRPYHSPRRYYFWGLGLVHWPQSAADSLGIVLWFGGRDMGGPNHLPFKLELRRYSKRALLNGASHVETNSRQASSACE